MRSYRYPWRLAAVALAALTAAAAHGGDVERALGPFPKALPEKARVTDVRELVTVIELAGDYAKGNISPRRAVAHAFYEEHHDDYDFLVVFTTFEFDTGQALAFYNAVRNDVSGIGEPIFDNSAAFGSAGRLQGYVDMAAVTYYELSPLRRGFSGVLATLAHELMHRWGISLELPGGDRSLLGDGSHWSFLVDTDASLMYGNDWRDNGDGTFTSVATQRFYSPLDLYLAGFYGPKEVPPFLVIEGSTEGPEQLPRLGATVSGTPRIVTIDEIVAANGPRDPADADAQRDFRFAFVLLHRPGETVDDVLIRGLADVRAKFLERFPILTGGRAVIDYAPPVTTDLEPDAPGPVTGGPPRPTANLADALAWLRGRQDAAGFWEDAAATRRRDTTVALATLEKLDPSFQGGGQARAWLGAEDDANLDDLARSIGAEAVASGALATAQNSDGGWGLAPGLASAPLDTALAVLALTARRDLGATGANRAAAFLLAAQNADGGWSNPPGGASQTATTTLALRALAALGRDAATPAAVAWLTAQQNADGGFGDSPSTSHDTANVLRTLIGLGQTAAINAAAAADYLRARQGVEGSWEGSVYTTALAVDALRRFVFPNWAFAGPLTASPAAPRDGERVRLEATVVNDGNAPTPVGVLRFFDGDPAVGGVQIGPDLALPALAPSGHAVAVAWWDSFGREGEATLVAVVDPDSAVDELSEADNRAVITVTVAPAPAAADLAVTPGDVTIDPPNPDELPVDLAISAVVRNFGQTGATGVRVVLWYGEPGTGTIAGERTLDLPARSSAVANFIFPLTAAGTTRLTVEVDPDGAVAEADEGNNRAVVDVTPRPNVDLAVTDADLTLRGGAAFLGRDAVFDVTVHNRGTLDAPQATVRFFVDDGGQEIPVQEVPVVLAGGESRAFAIPWRADRLGDLVFVAEIDPAGTVVEGDETNNRGVLPFSVSELVGANLTLESLAFVPDPAHEGAPAILRAVVVNTGDQALADVEVGFWEGAPPESGGAPVGAVQVVPSLDPGAAATVEVTTAPLVGTAPRLYFAVADPGGLVAELDEDDNRQFRELEVVGLPDLVVSPSAIVLTPPNPRPGDPVTVAVDVANHGAQPAADVGVRLLAGGAPVGDEVLPTVAAHGVATALFAWAFPAAGGTVTLEARVDPQGLVPEASEANNVARRAVTARDDDRVLSERYFSPDGDGVRDTTTLFFDADGAAVEIEVTNADGVVVRRHGPAAINAFEWDGRGDDGRVVDDGTYRLTARAGGAAVATAVTTVDTNRSPLVDALGTPFEKLRNLTCGLLGADFPFLTEDEQRIFFSNGSSRLRRIDADGGNLKDLVTTPFIFWEAAPDGRHIAYQRSATPRDHFLADGDGDNTVMVSRCAEPWCLPRFVTDMIFTSDSKGLLFSSRISFSEEELHVLSLDDFERRDLIRVSSRISFPFPRRTSPDGRKTIVYEPFGFDEDWHILDLETGELTFLIARSDTFVEPDPVWSPDGRRIAFLQEFYIEPTFDARYRLLVFSDDGELEATIPVPADHYNDLPAFTDVSGPLAGDSVPEVDFFSVSELDWSSTSDRVTFRTNAFAGWEDDGRFGVVYGQIFVADVLSGTMETVGYLEPFGDFASFYVSTWDGSEWAERGTLRFHNRYQEQTLDLSEFLPDPDGDYKVRIRQQGADAAHVDRVELRNALFHLEPASAVDAAGTDVLADVVARDWDVLDAHEKTFEVRWSLPAGLTAEDLATVELALLAREEDLSRRQARPFVYPPPLDDGVERVYNLVLGGGAKMRIDGLQTAADGLGEPLFAETSRPGTGHPAAVVYGYASSDDDHLYAALDFTVDNTEDDEQDWATLHVDAGNGWQSFRVTADDAAHGRVGFTRTGKVHHRHKYYEFQVPLAELGAAPGDVISLKLEAYGTAAVVDEDDRFMPWWGLGPYFLPNSDAIFYGGDFLGVNYLLRAGQPLAPQRILEDFQSFDQVIMAPSGRFFLFRDDKETLDPQSPCYDPGEMDLWSIGSLANLTAELEVSAAEAAGALLLEGTATDLHFASYRLEYADAEVPGFWLPIGEPSTTPLIDGTFATWSPPRSGSFLVRLTVEDLAGNTRQAVRRVSSDLFSGANALADVTVTPRLISPNGDRVQDAATARYTVLKPVHLEIEVRDAAGRRVRRIARDHFVTEGSPETFAVAWDGRDDAGLPVPDGDYRLSVQSFRFPVTVDTTPPRVELELLDAGITVEPRLVYCVEDPHLLGGVIETGEGATPLVWTENGPLLLPARCVRPDQRKKLKLSLGEFVDHRFRIDARDAAGNRTVVATPLGREELILYGLAQPPADLVLVSGGLVPLPTSQETLRFHLAETIRAGLVDLVLKVRSGGREFLVPPGEFTILGGGIPSEYLVIEWERGAVALSESATLWFEARDANGQTIPSNAIILGPRGPVYKGLLAPDWQTSGGLPPGQDDAVAQALAAAGLDPAEAPVLWAYQPLPEPLREVKLLLASDDDPRFARGVVLKPAGTAGATFVFDGSELAPCRSYLGQLTALVQTAAGQWTPVLSNDQLDRLPCLGLDFDAKPPATACGAVPPPVAELAATPESFNGAALRLLTVAVGDPDDVVWNVNDPESGHAYAFDLDVSGYEEGVYALFARLSSVEGEEIVLRQALVVDRTPPVVEITSPLAGSRQCGTPDGEGNVSAAITGVIEDLGGFTYQLFYEHDGIENRFPRDGEEPREPATGSVPLPLIRIDKELGRLGGFGSDVTVRLEAHDFGGNTVCAETTFFLDAAPSTLATASALPVLISPNGDGVADATTIAFAVDRPMTADVDVYAAVFNGIDYEPIGGPLVRVAGGVAVTDFGSVAWDGRRGDGSVIDDGNYLAVVTLRDGCGRVLRPDALVVVDTTPPALAILTPAAGDVSQAVVEVVGTVADPSSPFYRLEAGTGADPLVWSLLGEGPGVSNGLLAVWQTFGLSGTYTLRLSATDAAGNAASTRRTVNVVPQGDLIHLFEAVPPVFSPNGDGLLDATTARFGLLADAEVTLTVLTEAGAAVRTLAGAQPFGSGTSTVPWNGLDAAGQRVADGRYVLRLAATAGPSSQQEELTVLVDTTPPRLEIRQPDGFAPASFCVVGTIDDARLQSWTLAFTATPAAPAWQELARGGTPQLDAVLACLDSLAESAYALRLTGADRAGNRAERAFPFVVDATPPTAALLSPADGASVSGAAGPVTVAGEGADAHPASYRLEFGAGDPPAAWTVLAAGDGAPPSPVTAPWNVAALADGLYSVRLVVEDQAGQSATGVARATVDNTPPVVAITAPADGAFLTAAPWTVTGTAVDAALDRYRVEVAPRGSGRWSLLGMRANPVNDGVLLGGLALPPDGDQTLRLVAYDAAGNQATARVDFSVDSTPPAPPTGLDATVIERRDVRLDWTASASADVTGYRVERLGTAVAGPLAATTHLDAAAPEGTLVYTVRAIDRAGLVSAPSNAVEVLLDRTPPATAIHAPANGARVSGMIDVKITATSRDDFQGYRLLAGDGAGGFDLLRTSPLPANAEVVAQWDVTGLAAGAEVPLVLESEDLHGNVGRAEARVIVDNQPPARPTGLTAAANGSNVDLAWNANVEPDLAGYLLYRDGRLVNSAAATVDDLLRLALKATAYTDAGVPDGSWTYGVAAIDAAGNVSPLSDPAAVDLDQRAPRVTIVEPANGSAVEGAVFVLGETADRDVATVLFQFKAPADAAWTDLGPAADGAPWEATWDPAGLPFGNYQLRAVATDAGSRVDPSPAAVTVTYDDLTPPRPLTGLAVNVDGGDVSLSWNASPAADLAGYHVFRTLEGGTEVRLTAAPLASPAYLDAGLADGSYEYTVTAVDDSANASEPSEPRTAVVYTPELEPLGSPIRELVTALDGRGAPGEAAGEVTNAAGTSPIAPVATDAEGRFHFAAIALARGDNTLAIRITDAAGNVSKPATAVVTSAAAPSAPTGLAATVAGHDVDLDWNANPEPDVLGYRVFRGGEPLLAEAPVAGLTASASDFFDPPSHAIDGDFDSGWWLPTSESAGHWLELTLPGPRRVTAVDVLWWVDFSDDYSATDFDVEVWNGHAWQTGAAVRDGGAERTVVPLDAPYVTDRVRVVLLAPNDWISIREIAVLEQSLVAAPGYRDTAPDGFHDYQVSAVNVHGFESPLSEPLEVAVGDVTPPDPVVLTGVVNGSEVLLGWTPSPALDLARYDVYRGGARVAEVTGLTFAELRPNGTWQYYVRAVDAVGNSSAPSNVVSVTVAAAPPAPPQAVTVTAPDTGGALDLAWQAGGDPPAAIYRVLRATVSGGPYATVAETAGLSYRDTGLVNGTKYYYVIAAVDAAGNANGAAEVSGTPRDRAAPAPPVLTHPAVLGLPYFTTESTAEVVAISEPDALVTLRRNGEIVGSARAGLALVAGAHPVGGGDFSDPRLSPDGRWLLYGSLGDHFLHDFETGDTILFSFSRERVTWAIDSRKVFYPDFFNRYIWIYDVLDDTFDRVDANNASDLVIAVQSPEGGRLAVLGTFSGTSGLWVLDIDSSARDLLLDEAHSATLARGSLQWSPDGDRLVYLRLEPAAQVEVFDLATRTVEVIETQPGPLATPHWSPDGAALVFTSVADGGEQVWIWEAATGGKQALTAAPGEHRSPQWSPDGRRVAYVTAGTTGYVEDLATGAVVSFPAPGAHTLEWTRGGHLLVLGDKAERVTPAGRAGFGRVALVPGDNVLTAVAEDRAGNRGNASAPMLVVFEAGTLPDLTIDDLVVVPAAPLTGEPATASVTVRNAGAADAGPSALDLFLAGPNGFRETLLLGAAVEPLAAGAVRTLAAGFAVAGEPGLYTLEAAVDPAGDVLEDDEDDNRAELVFAVAETAGVALTAATDRTSYRSNDDVFMTFDVLNAGPAWQGRLEVRVEDAGGALVEAPAPVAVKLEFGEFTTYEAVWNTGTVYAGSYRVRALLVEDAGTADAEGVAPFAVESALQLTAEVVTGRARYPAGAHVDLTASVRYAAGNAVVTGTALRLTILDAAGAVRREWRPPLGYLLPGAESRLAFGWPSSGAAAGTYRARVEVLKDGAALASAETFFDLVPGAARVEGTLSLSPASPAVGEGLAVSWTLHNVGATAIAGLPVQVVLYDPGRDLVLRSAPSTVDLAAGGRASGTVTFDTAGLELKSYLALLRVDLRDKALEPGLTTLHALSFATLDHTPPALAVDVPRSAAFVGRGAAARLRAVDALSRVESVAVRVDGGPWTAATPADLAAGRWTRALDGLADGPHQLTARAIDSWDNVAVTGPVSFVADLTPPRIVITGVVDGTTYDGPVTPRIEILEANPATESILLNGAAFVSGTEVAGERAYRLRVVAEDLAGNRAVAKAQFTIGAPPVPDLTASKTVELAADADGDGVASPGDELRYRVTLARTGAGVLTNAAFDDVPPAGTTLVPGSVTTSQGTVASADPIRVEAGEMTDGVEVEIAFRVTLTGPFAVGTTPVANQGTVTSDQHAGVLTDDPGLPGAADPTAIDVVFDPDPALAAGKTDALAVDADGNLAPSPGDTLEYVVTVANGGLGQATNVAITDSLPADLALVPGSVVASAGTVTDFDPLTVDLGTVAAGAQAQISFKVVIDAGLDASVGEVVNQGTVTSAELAPLATDDPDLPGAADPTVTALTHLPGNPVITASKTAALAVDADGNGVVSPGDVLEYTITVSNSGDDAATGVSFFDAVPQHTALLPGSVIAGAGTVDGEDPVEVTFGDLAAGAQVEIRFRVTIDPALAPGVAEIVNQGQVSSAELPLVVTDDPTLPGRADATATPVVHTPTFPVLAAAKTAVLWNDAGGDGEASPGDVLEYLVTVTNTGTAPATQVSLYDEVPLHTTYLAGTAQASRGVMAGTDPLRVEWDALGPGEEVEVRFQVRIDVDTVPGVTEIVNQGNVLSKELPLVLTDDPDLPGAADATVTALTHLPGNPVITASKTAALASDTDGNGVVSPGDVLEYTITVANSGDAAATGVSFFDAVPQHTALVPGSATAGAGTVDGEDPVGVSLGDLAAGVQVEIRFRVTIDPALAPEVAEIVNQGQVSSAELPLVVTDDPAQPGVADATATPVVFAPTFPVLAAAKIAVLGDDAGGDGEASPGDVLEYLVTIANTGTAPATQVRLYDEMPLHTTYLGGTAQVSGGVMAGTDPLQVEWAALAPGEEVEVRFQVRIDAGAGPGVTEIVNQGNVLSKELPLVLTDDPNLPGIADATVTALAHLPGNPVITAAKTAALAADADGNAVVSPGDVLEYAITVANSGDAAATGVSFFDAVPQHTALVAGSVTAGAGTVHGEDPVEVTLGDLVAGAQVEIRFRVTIDPALAPEVAEIVNQGQVSSAELPLVVTDDPALPGVADATATPVVHTATFPLLAAAKIAVLWDDAGGDGQASPGDVIEYVVTIANTGTAPATLVSLYDEVPLHTTYLAGTAQASRGVMVGTDPLRVEWDALGPGEEVEVRFQVRIDAGAVPGVTEIVNQGNVLSQELPLVLTDDPSLPGTADATRTLVSGAPAIPEIPALDVRALASLALLLTGCGLWLVRRRA